MKETKDSSQRLNKAEKSWILYDVANSAFIMIVTATIPIYFRSLAEGSGLSLIHISSRPTEPPHKTVRMVEIKIRKLMRSGI